jgi:hypothetical protein
MAGSVPFWRPPMMVVERLNASNLARDGHGARLIGKLADDM